MFDEINSDKGRLVGVELCSSVGGRGVATCHLVDSSDPFETSDVEGVVTDQITGVIGVDVPGLSLFPRSF